MSISISTRRDFRKGRVLTRTSCRFTCTQGERGATDQFSEFASEKETKRERADVGTRQDLISHERQRRNSSREASGLDCLSTERPDDADISSRKGWRDQIGPGRRRRKRRSTYFDVASKEVSTFRKATAMTTAMRKSRAAAATSQTVTLQQR
jgi:hypothetical protein